MGERLRLEKYSLGVGDRFAHQARAQLTACMRAAENGIDVVPVWNKSKREHTIIGSGPQATRNAAEAAVKALGWTRSWYCDADHIGRETVSGFLGACDYFTIDVADWIGRAAKPDRIESFLKRHPELVGEIRIDGADRSFSIKKNQLESAARKYLAAVIEASDVYRAIEAAKGSGTFVPEVSMDETDLSQNPVELLVILAAAADEQIPLQAIAPKFSGRFNKGVDYVGNVAMFAEEFALDIAAIAQAVRWYGLPSNLKLSIHSGSDKFSIYPAIHTAIRQADAGVHLKTAGTTWLEELIGLAEAGGDGLELAKEIYAESVAHRRELCAPYATVVAIDERRLPVVEEVRQWSSDQFVAALRHDTGNPSYNPVFRQLLHVAFKIAAQMGPKYLRLIEDNEIVIARNVTENLYKRHLVPVFGS